MSNKDNASTERNQNSEHKYRLSSKHDYDYRTVGIVGTASFCVVLPKEYAINLGVGKGDFVKVSQDQNRIIIEKALMGEKKEMNNNHSERSCCYHSKKPEALAQVCGPRSNASDADYLGSSDDDNQ